MPARRVALALAGALALLIAAFQVPLFAAQGEAASREIAKAATLVYVSLRAVNAALSVAQELELGATAVASATTQPLKVLDPVDDTIERIAGVVFTVAAASWVLSVAFGPLATIGFAALGAGLLCLAVADRWPALAATARSLMRTGLILALVLPLVYAGGTTFGRLATAGTAAEAQATLDGVARDARILIGRETGEAPTATTDPGILSGMFGRMDQMRDQIASLANAADYYWTKSDDVLHAAFTLIAVFVLRMLILPGALLFLIWRLVGRLA